MSTVFAPSDSGLSSKGSSCPAPSTLSIGPTSDESMTYGSAGKTQDTMEKIEMQSDKILQFLKEENGPYIPLQILDSDSSPPASISKSFRTYETARRLEDVLGRLTYVGAVHTADGNNGNSGHYPPTLEIDDNGDESDNSSLLSLSENEEQVQNDSST